MNLRTLMSLILIPYLWSCGHARVSVSGENIDSVRPGNTFSTSSGSYIFAPGDVVEVYIHRQPGLSGSFLISPSGYIQMPKIGPVFAKNRSVDFMKQTIQIKVRPFVKYAKVSINTGRLSSYKVIFSGQVRRPGTYVFNKKTTLLEGLAEAGGVLRRSKQVVLIRKDSQGNSSRYVTDYKTLLSGEKGTDGLVLERGDIIFIN